MCGIEDLTTAKEPGLWEGDGGSRGRLLHGRGGVSLQQAQWEEDVHLQVVDLGGLQLTVATRYWVSTSPSEM